MRKTVFTKHLENASEEELRQELAKLFDSYKEVKELYAMELGSTADRQKIYDQAKKKIAKFYERFKTRARQTKVNEIIKHLDGISIFDHELADLYLFHAEQVIDWLNYFTIRPVEWRSFTKSFKRGLELVLKSMSEDEFKERIYTIVDKSDCGWDTQPEAIELVDSILGNDFLVDKTS
jgi:hypothetical protein